MGPRVVPDQLERICRPVGIQYIEEASRTVLGKEHPQLGSPPSPCLGIGSSACHGSRDRPL